MWVITNKVVCVNSSESGKNDMRWMISLTGIFLLVLCASTVIFAADAYCDDGPDPAKIGEPDNKGKSGESDGEGDSMSSVINLTGVEEPGHSARGTESVVTGIRNAIAGGAFADIAVYNNELWVIAESKDRKSVNFFQNFKLVENVANNWPYAPYVRGCDFPDGVAAAFQAGDYPAAHWNGKTYTWTDDGIIFGVDVIDIVWSGQEFIVAYLVKGAVVTRWVNLAGETIKKTRTPTDTTQGIHRVFPDGTFSLVDDIRLNSKYPLLYRPFIVDNDFAAGENSDQKEDRGLIYFKGKPMVFNRGISYRPRAVAFNNGYAVIVVLNSDLLVVQLSRSDLEGAVGAEEGETEEENIPPDNVLRKRIRGFYLKYLHREPDQRGWDYYMRQVKGKALTVDQVEEIIKESGRKRER